MASATDTTLLLANASHGDAASAEQLMPLVYDELRALAASYLRRERPDHTLQATALVNEAFARLFDQKRVNWKGQSHYFAIAAEMIRRILVDHARKRAAAKRGGGVRTVTLADAAGVASASSNVDVLELDEAMGRLATLSPRQERVVTLHFYGGLGFKEIAGVVGVSERTAKGDWRVARAWLRQQISPVAGR